MAEKQTFLERVRGNAEWEAIKAGWLLMIPVLYAFFQHLRSVHIDWIGLTILFVLCLIAGHLILRQTRQSSNHAPLAIPAPISADDSETVIRFSEARAKLDYIALHDKGYACSQTFTSLQMEALTLSGDLRKFLDDAEVYPAAPVNPSFDDAYDHYRGKGYDWGIRFRAKYDAQFSARMRDFASHLEIERARVNSILRKGFEGVHTAGMIEKLQGELWREAMYAADVDFNKDYRNEA